MHEVGRHPEGHANDAVGKRAERVGIAGEQVSKDGFADAAHAMNTCYGHRSREVGKYRPP